MATPTSTTATKNLFHIRIRQRDKSNEEPKKFLIKAETWAAALERIATMVDDGAIKELNHNTSITVEMSSQRLVES